MPTLKIFMDFFFRENDSVENRGLSLFSCFPCLFSLCDFELKHRVKGKSFRRLLFSKEIELMRALNVQWEVRKRNEINEILAKAPYDDAIEG
jgi:hypothetical protein